VKRTLYHCTQRYVGPVLCVCSTVSSCFASRFFDPAPVHVYRTPVPRRGIRPTGVWDQVVTGERWLIEGWLVHERTVPVELVARATEAVRLYHRTVKRKSTVRLRVAQLRIAHEVLGGPQWQARLLEMFERTLRMETTGEDYVLAQLLAKETA
jgi:hypothetical protein